MVVTEQVFRYPRRITVLLEIVCALAVLLAGLNFGRDLLSYLWFSQGLDTSLFAVVPFLSEIVSTLRASQQGNTVVSLTGLMPSLGWLLLALLLSLLVRNSFPTIRTSARGMLVAFGSDWLPVPWESLRAIKVTEDVGGKRYILLAETEKPLLTGWHRFYSFFYRLRFGRAFLISSAISDFEELVKTLLNESDRVAKVLATNKPATLDEDAASPMFRFLLNPAGFFSQNTRNEVPIEPGVQPASDVAVSGAYPPRITGLLGWTAVVVGAIAIIRYIIYWLQFLALTFPNLLNTPLFSRIRVTEAQLVAPWWVLVAAHLMALLALFVSFGLRNMLPAVEVRREGLAVRYGRGWSLTPWSKVENINETHLSETNQIILIQVKSRLPFWSRAASLLYHGSFKPGILMTSALSHYETIIERIVLEVARYQTETEAPSDTPIVQDDAPSPLLLMVFRAGATIDQLVEIVQDDNETLNATPQQIWRAALPMMSLAVLPALLAFADRAISQALLPDWRLLIGMLVMFLLSMLEWPLMTLGAMTLDEVAGKGEEGYRALYLYPLVQLPRVLLLIAALVFTVLGVPYLPILIWIGAIVLSFLLSAGLWEALYQWRGGQLLAGGLVPVVYQLLVLLAYLLVFH